MISTTLGDCESSMQVHSFDVFDTCVSRMHAYPRDVFYDIGLRLATELPTDSTRAKFARRFQRARVRAEKISNLRARPKSESADIFTIYSNLRWLMRIDRSIDDLIELELEVERETIFPIMETLEHIQKLRDAGHRILFISDMYLPGRLLAGILIEKGVMKSDDALYVSCDIGLTKHRGSLYQHVLKTEGLSGPDLVHTGDNAHSDISMAAAHRIHTRHYTRAHLNAREIALSGGGLYREPSRSWQASFSRRCRIDLSGKDVGNSLPLDDVVLGVVTPFLLVYLEWIFATARQRGIQRLYFVARDGEILYKIASALRPADIELRYLYGSRRAWLAPSISETDLEWERLLVVAGNASAPTDIASRAGLDQKKQARLRTLLGFSDSEWIRSLSMDEARGFLKKVISAKDAFAFLLESSKEQWGTALKYFQQEGLLDGSAWALVDAGWSLNSQASLKRILEKAIGEKASVQGFYIGLARDHFDTKQAGQAFAFTSPPGALLSRRRVIVEHCFLPSTHASTRGYVESSGGVVPIFSPDPRSRQDLAYAERLHTLAMKATDLVKRSPSLQNALRQHAEGIRHATKHFIQSPRPEEAALMSEFVVVADMRQESRFAQSLCPRLSFKDVWTTIAMTVSGSRTFATPAWMWLEGSIALSPLLVQIPLRLMLKLDDLKNQLQSWVKRDE